MADEEVVVTLPEDLSGPLVDQIILNHQSDDDGDADRGGKKAAVEEPDDDAIADLKNQFGQLQTRTQHLENEVQNQTARADKLQVERDTAVTGQVHSELETIKNGILAAQAEADNYETLYKDAAERGDFNAMAKAQRGMAQAESRITPLKMAASEIEGEIKRMPKPGERREAPPQRPAAPQGDPVENYLATRTPKSAAWLRNHIDLVENGGPAKKLVAAHLAAVDAAGLTPDTPEYFDHVEQTLGIKKVAKDPKQQERQQQQTQRRPSAPSAPVVNSGGGLQGGKSEVKLTANEVKAATDGTIPWNYDDPSGQKRFKKGDPIGVSEFARRKALDMAAGKYDKTLTE